MARELRCGRDAVLQAHGQVCPVQQLPPQISAALHPYTGGHRLFHSCLEDSCDAPSDDHILSSWHRRNFLLLLDDRQLCCCLEEKCLYHLLFSKKMVPEEMVLSPAFCTAKLSQCLTQQPAARAQALHEFKEL